MSIDAAFRRVWSALASQVTRGKLTLSGYSPGGARTMLNGVGLEGEIHQQIELLLPYGMSARPVGQTADYLLLQINAVRDHKVALGADDPALRIPDLAEGEFGFRNGRGSQVVFRVNKIEITAPLDDIDLTAAAGNVNVVASAGDISLSSHGHTVAMGAGNMTINIDGAANIAATGSIVMTAPAGQIKANGNVLG